MKIAKRQLRRIIKEELAKEVSLPGDRYGRQSAADARAVRSGLDSTSPSEIKSLVNQGLQAFKRAGIAFDYDNDDQVDDLYTWVEKRMRDSLRAEDFERALEDVLDAADQKAAEEILSTRMGSYKGTTLPGGKKIK